MTGPAGPSARPGTDPAVPAARRKETLAACKDALRAEILPHRPDTVSGKILRRERRSLFHHN
ncbi:hypothetical protein GCM10010297_55070 [Streptomyces malachitofuscus]|nr:hypothetical protein GCM10010297_55070 [Streptomyces malachitofuscus]